MGIWAEIKHAINSTLGTNEFIPLDKLIKSQRTLGASDSTLIVLSNSTTSTGSIVKTIGTVKSNVKGNVRLRIYGYGTSGVTALNPYHAWVEDSFGSVVGSIIMGTNSEYNWYSVDFSVKPEENYTVYIQHSRGDKFIIGASVIDGSMMTLED